MHPLIDFFGIKDFIPHGYCLSWSPILLWLHVVSDLLITFAYYSIPLTLVYFIHKRKDLPYPWMVALFAGFIIACGTTHLMSAITIWIPLYRLDGLIKAFTAIISIAWAALMLWVIPRILSLPSAAQLTAEIQRRNILEDQLGLFHSLFELTSDCVFMISPKEDFRFVYVNDAVCQHYGIERAQLLKSGITDLDTNVKNQTDIDALCEELKTKKGLLLKTVHRVAYDREVPVEISFNYLSYKGDEYIAGYFHDITERKLAEDKLQASALYARSLIETSLDPLVTISAEGKIMDVNQATIAVTGVEREQLIGSDFSDYFTNPDHARSGYQQVFSQGYLTDYPLAIRHGSGKVTEVLYNASVYRNAQGEVAGIFAAARDVTGIKRIEAELRQTNADLESFSYSVSHDLRAPLRAIDGFSNILREDYAVQLDAEGRRLFQVVSDNAKNMGQLIDDILFLSRASRHEMYINQIDIKALAQEVWDDLAADRTGRAIEFRLTDLPMAYADNSALRQVLQNLLGNAIKFTRGREPAIIEMGGTVEGKENIYFIRDNGAGFDMIYANKLFCLFQRLHSITEFEGTGVGLAIVKRFIIKHDGRIWAEGKPGEGATFWFTLPIQQHVEPKHE